MRAGYGCIVSLKEEVSKPLSDSRNMKGSRRADRRSLPDADNEKDLPAAQPPPQADPRIPGPYGHAGGKKRTEAPPRQGTSASDDSGSSQATRLDERRADGGLGRDDRLRKSAQFVVLQRRGLRSHSQHFVLYGLEEDESAHPRLGITVSRRIGSAVVRNRLKRRVRECFRLRLRRMLPAGTMIVVIARQGAADLKGTAIDQELAAASADLIRRLHPKAGTDVGHD
jgi:ribonuclease P protein component